MNTTTISDEKLISSITKSSDQDNILLNFIDDDVIEKETNDIVSKMISLRYLFFDLENRVEDYLKEEHTLSENEKAKSENCLAGINRKQVYFLKRL